MVALTVAGIIAGLIILDVIGGRVWMGMRQRERGRASGAHNRLPALDGQLRAIVSPGVFHYRGHTWAHWRPEGDVVTGADDFLHRVIGRIDEVRPPATGDVLKQGDKAVLLRQGDRVLYLTSPVTGTVRAVNKDLAWDASLIKMSPYDNGWLFTVSPSRPEEDIRNLMIAERARAWLEREVRRIRFFMNARLKTGESTPAGEGPVDINGILEKMNEETWILFKDQFIYQREWRS